MIKLVIITDITAPMTYCFDQSVVTIGSSASPYADLTIPEETLQERHIQIINEPSRFIVINIANDPFATLNGQPFGKKTLKHQDLIQIGNTTIRFEQAASPIGTAMPSALSVAQTTNDKDISDLVDTKEILPIIVEEAICAQVDKTPESAPSESFAESLPWEEEQTILEYKKQSDLEKGYSLSEEDDSDPDDDEMEQMDLDALVRQVEELAENEEAYQMYHEAVNQATFITQPPIDELPLNESENDLPEPTQNVDICSEESPAQKNSFQEPVEKTSFNNSLHGTSSTPSKNGSQQKLSLKDYYLSEYDDITEQTPPTPSATPSNLPKILAIIKNWRLYLKILIAFFALAAIGAGLVFLWISDQSDKEEVNASKGVADVAMALTYAQIKHIRPQNQNWSDPEFIKNNLMAVIASHYTSLAEFDAHGQFTNSPYMLRIYTSGDLSQFLVIAQPAPSLLQWLIPKTTIILDSRVMEMRKIKDLKNLNRLLVNTNTLDGTNAIELLHLIQQGRPIPLINLVSKNEHHGFTPPKALGLLRPGAENLIYNAPRYYPLGEELIKKSIDLIEKPASSHEVSMLQQELSSLSKFPNAILYSSGGLQHAIQAQRALATLSPKEKFLIAYLQINPKGVIVNSHMLMDDSPQDVAISEVAKPGPVRQGPSSPFTNQSTDQIPFSNEAKDFGTINANSEDSQQQLAYNMQFDEDNPLFLQLSALNVFRQQALRPISEQMTILLNKQTQSAQPNFTSQYQLLLNKYLEINNEQQAKITRKLEGIYRENTHLPASEFLNLGKVAGLGESLRDYLGVLKHQMTTPEFTQEKMDKRLQRIEKAANWQDLEQIVAETVEVLQLDKVPDEDRIVTYQTATRSRVIQKLNQFLLSPEHPLPPQAFDSEYRYTLINILKMSWINDADTCDFYLSEFDLRTSPRGQLEEDDENEEI